MAQGRKLWALVQSYGVAFLLTAAVIAGRWALNPLLGRQSNRHLVFLPTVMLVAWFAGWGPGLLSALLCTMAISYFWMDPAHHIFHPSVDLALFFVIAVAIATLIESLRRARARADAAARAREQVLAVVAHDLRNPLAAIQMNTAGLQEETPDPETLRRRLAAIDRSAQRMDNLINDLMEVTRIDHGQLSLAVHPTEVESMVRETVDMFAFLARSKGITLATETSGAAAAVTCDRERVLQVLGNLVGNALRFTPDGGRIVLATEPQGRGVRFSVADTGPGIRNGDLPHIFEPFWHSDSKGTGLGLYIAQSLIRAHGSHIDVETTPGQGTRFAFVLPVAAAQPSPA